MPSIRYTSARSFVLVLLVGCSSADGDRADAPASEAGAPPPPAQKDAGPLSPSEAGVPGPGGSLTPPVYLSTNVFSALVLTNGNLVHWGYRRFPSNGAWSAGPQGLPSKSSLKVDLRTIDGGESLTCGLLTAGGVACLGGDVPDPWVTNELVHVAGAENAVQLAVGGAHACVLNADGTIFCWGRNANGQLGTAPGLGGTSLLGVPGEYAGVASGARGSCAVVAADKTVRCWGDALGEVPTAVWPGDPPDEISMGGYEGTTFVCGRFGTKVRCTGEFAKHSLSVAATSLTAGATSFCVRSAAGPLACWGYSPSPGNPASTVSKEYVVTGLPLDASPVTLGGGFGCAVAGTGILCWGDNQLGQLGQGDKIAYPETEAHAVKLP